MHLVGIIYHIIKMHGPINVKDMFNVDTVDTVGYMKLRRQRPELWSTVGYMKLCVDRDLNCG